MGQLNCKTKKICIGDLKYRITIQLRDIKAPSNIDFSEEYTDIATVWSYVKVISDYFRFDKTNLNDGATHIFYIRYRTDIDINNWILYKAQRYKIKYKTKLYCYW